jgi:hypothetical protein
MLLVSRSSVAGWIVRPESCKILLKTNLLFRKKEIRAIGTARIAPAAKGLIWNDFNTAMEDTANRYVVP